MMRKKIEWNDEKNKLLLKMRGVCFDEVLEAIEKGKIIDSVTHPNQEKYPNQKVLIVELKDYIYEVPYVEDEEKIFLKTIFPSRKSKKIYTK